MFEKIIKNYEIKLNIYYFLLIINIITFIIGIYIKNSLDYGLLMLTLGYHIIAFKYFKSIKI